MSFFQNIIADSRPRSTQFKSSPFLESPQQTMELREESGGFEAHLSDKNDEYGTAIRVQDDTSSGDYAGSDQRPKNKHLGNNSDPQSQFVKDQALSDKDDRPQEEGGVRSEHQPVTISETFSSEKKNARSFEYTVETLTEPVNADGTNSSDLKVAQESEPERNNSSKAVRPEDESPMQTVGSASEGEFDPFNSEREIAPDKKSPIELTERPGKTDIQHLHKTVPDASQKEEGAPLAGRKLPKGENTVADPERPVVSRLQHDSRQLETAAVDSTHTLQGNSPLHAHSVNHQSDSGQNSPMVHIGRIDVVIESPQQEITQQPARKSDVTDFASRHYLRRL